MLLKSPRGSDWTPLPPSPSLLHCISPGVQQGLRLQPSQMGRGDPGSLSFPLVFSALLVALLGGSATPPRALGYSISVILQEASSKGSSSLCASRGGAVGCCDKIGQTQCPINNRYLFLAVLEVPSQGAGRCGVQ